MFYCELLSGLWIGDTDILVNEKIINDNNIKIIINCTKIFDFPNKLILYHHRFQRSSHILKKK